MEAQTEMTAQVLKGIRIADFSAVVAGPFCSLLLSSLGAEVIHISAVNKDDTVRKSNNARYNAVNLNRSDIGIDLKDPRGLELARQLVKKSDVVVENLRPGVMDRLGVGYAALKQIKPDIIMISSSGFGATGPEKNYGGFATNFVAASGLSQLIGYRDGMPNEERGPADFRSGQTMALTVMIALLHRQRTGEGQQIDLSQTAAHCSGLGDVIMDYIINGRIGEPKGNDDDVMAPHNAYRCKGDDKWISIAVGTDNEWNKLCQVMGNPDWSKEEIFATCLNRFKNREELDSHITEWTKNKEDMEAMQVLQAAGVAAMPCCDASEIFADKSFQERHFLGQVTYCNEKQTVLGVPFILSKTPADVYHPAPTWGEQTDSICKNIFGMTGTQIMELKQVNVIK
jgi:benzylsuccinate CoA-transferase BbsF subunit